MRKFTAFLLIAALALSLCSCGAWSGSVESAASAQPEASAASAASDAPVELELRYVPEEIPLPDWLEGVTSWSFSGDTLWLVGTAGDALLLVGYDTLSGEWLRYDIDAEGLMHNPGTVDVSAAGDSVWVLLRENMSEEDWKSGLDLSSLGYYVYYLTPSSGESRLTRVPISGDEGSEGGGTLDFASLVALDENRALLTSYERAYLTGPALNAAELTEFPAGLLLSTRAGGALYIYTDSGIAPLDTDALTLGEPISGTGPCGGGSNTGRLLNTAKGVLYSCEPSTGELTEVLEWMNVALRYGDESTISFFENSAGAIFYAHEDALVRVTQQELPKKRVLKLACFGDANDVLVTGSLDGYSISDELRDAVIRFNNTDSEYRVEIESILYESDADRDRLLIELATGDEYDIIDTSFLPENALDSGVLADLLPYLDADEDISREDFIEPLLAAMQRGGKLYEYCPRFSMLSLAASDALFDSCESWTAGSVQAALSGNSELETPARDRLIDGFLLAATAEFIDWDSQSCSFDSAEFQGWLELLTSLPESKDYYERPAALYVEADLVQCLKYTLKDSKFLGSYSVTGFPSSSGTGSYFMRFGDEYGSYLYTIGQNTRVGVMESSANKDGAWRFVKTLMLGGDTLGLTYGIPVLKSAFESALASALESSDSEYALTEADAELLREQVYNTTKLASADEALLSILRSEAQACFAGQKTAADAAKQIQSRVSIYLAEQG